MSTILFFAELSENDFFSGIWTLEYEDFPISMDSQSEYSKESEFILLDTVYKVVELQIF